MRKIYVVGGNTGYASWMEGELTMDPRIADLIVFTGGTDVGSHYYGEPRHPLAEKPDDIRDVMEHKQFVLSAGYGKHLIGICRGAQFLCVMAGGKLVQHQENKHPHSIRTWLPFKPTVEGPSFMAAGDHHQAQWPHHIKNYKILGWTMGMSEFHQDGNGNEMIEDPRFGVEMPMELTLEVEDVYYPDIKALAIQCHPEWMDEKSPAVSHYRKLLNLHMEDKL